MKTRSTKTIIGQILMLAIFILLVSAPSYGAPNFINFQGRLNDSLGSPVTDPTVSMNFKIYDSETSGALVWEETQTVNVQEGIYNILLGSSTIFGPTLYDSDNRWLEVVVNGERLDPRQRIVSVAYALQANEAGHAGSADSVSSPLNLSGFNANPILSSTNNGTGNGVYGESTSGTGVYGKSLNGNDYGVYGMNASNGSYGFLGSALYGVFGESSTDYGMFGSFSGNGNFGYMGDFFDGVYGESHNSNGAGVYGFNPGSGYGVFGVSIGGYSGYFQGDVHVTGTISATSKPFIQPHAKDPSKEIVYIATEGPEAVVFHRGTAKLVQGKAVIDMPEHFRLVAAEDGIQVQVTPLEDCNGMFTASKSKEQIVIQELGGGKSNSNFDYYVTAVREGFENHKPVVANTHFKPRNDETAQEFEKRYSKDDMSTKAVQTMLISNGILTREGKLNMAKVKELGWTVSDKSRAEKRIARRGTGPRN